MKKTAVLMFCVFVLAAFVCAADAVKKVEKDVKQTASDLAKAGKTAVEKTEAAGKAVAEKGKEVVTGAAAATTMTAAAVGKDTEKAGKSIWEHIMDFGRKIKHLFSK
jgi:hypothetical protein